MGVKRPHVVLFTLAAASQFQMALGHGTTTATATATTNMQHAEDLKYRYTSTGITDNSNDTSPIVTNHEIHAGDAPAAAPAGVIHVSHKDFERVFMTYDRHEDDAPECMLDTEDIGFDNQLLCPHDLRVACGELSGIESHCAALLGSEMMSRYASGEVSSHSGAGVNAYSGCINYVSYHVWEPHEHLGCCESDFCENWHDEILHQLYYDEFDGSFDDDFIPMDDDEYHTEF